MVKRRPCQVKHGKRKTVSRIVGDGGLALALWRHERRKAVGIEHKRKARRGDGGAALARWRQERALGALVLRRLPSKTTPKIKESCAVRRAIVRSCKRSAPVAHLPFHIQSQYCRHALHKLTPRPSIADMQQRSGKQVIQVFGANAVGKGTRFRYLVDEQKKRLGADEWVPWSCDALGGKTFGVLFLPTGLLVLGFPSQEGKWTCLDAVPKKGSRLNMMHEALDDCRVSMVLWEGFLGLPALWNTASAMQQEFGEGITVSTYMFFYSEIEEYRCRTAERVRQGAAGKSGHVSGLAVWRLRNAEKDQGTKDVGESAVGWQKNIGMVKWFKSNNGCNLLPDDSSGDDTSPAAYPVEQPGNLSENRVFRVSVNAPKDVLWKMICK